jgi:hypothetical protein
LGVTPAISMGSAHVFANRAPRQQRRGLENEADLVVQPRLPRRAAAHGDGALGRGEDIGDEAQERGFPASRRADQRRETALRER